MSSVPLLIANPVQTHSVKLSNTASFYLLASMVVSLLAGSSALTPLYPIYQAAWGFSAITTTIVFGAYALAVLGALLTVGSLSDQIGRRPVLIGAFLVQAVMMLLFATAENVSTLMVGRIIQGLSTGAAVGALGAAMLDLNRAKGTIANAVGPMMGTAVGALGSGVLVQYLPAPMHLVYVVLFGIFVLQTIGVMMMTESSTPLSGTRVSLRFQFSVPPAVRPLLLVIIPTLVGAWSLAGFYGSLGPALLRSMTHSSSSLLGGLALFALAGSGSTAVWLTRAISTRTMLLVGIPLLVVGAGITLIAITYSSVAVFFIGTALAGAGFGVGFRGVITSVLPLVAPHERSGVLSFVYVVSYVAMGLPAVAAGFLVVYDGSILTTARIYIIAVMALAALACLSIGMQRRQSSS